MKRSRGGVHGTEPRELARSAAGALRALSGVFGGCKTLALRRRLEAGGLRGVRGVRMSAEVGLVSWRIPRGLFLRPE
eukprot:scaffold3351_cov242-Pinguiococcus_pyrenoidosus.AAC.1